MPAHWQEWDKAKKELKSDAKARGSALDEALRIVNSAQKAAKNPGAMRCPACGGMKFKTQNKGTQWACRLCGHVVKREEAAP
ncbi:MAG: hypothetical protein FJ317_00195 [SAR202 cluster bacterium]|nr:hypothetical protein [SAR202 cluster bacterium]